MRCGSTGHAASVTRAAHKCAGPALLAADARCRSKLLQEGVPREIRESPVSDIQAPAALCTVWQIPMIQCEPRLTFGTAECFTSSDERRKETHLDNVTDESGKSGESCATNPG
jgi:hypothetical protein